MKHYERLYPEHSDFTGYISYDPQYYKYYFARWREGEMPTAEMLASALPEGHLLPGGDITGFLFFEKIPAEHAKLTFNANLVNSSTGELFGFVTIPLRAQPPIDERRTP